MDLTYIGSDPYLGDEGEGEEIVNKDNYEFTIVRYN